MSTMSELHDDLATIHAVILGQRQVAQLNMERATKGKVRWAIGTEQWNLWFKEEQHQAIRVNCLTDLLLELEAAGVVWPDNVVEMDVQEAWDKGLPVYSLGDYDD